MTERDKRRTGCGEQDKQRKQNGVWFNQQVVLHSTLTNSSETSASPSSLRDSDLVTQTPWQIYQTMETFFFYCWVRVKRHIEFFLRIVGSRCCNSADAGHKLHLGKPKIEEYEKKRIHRCLDNTLVTCNPVSTGGHNMRQFRELQTSCFGRCVFTSWLGPIPV